MNNNDIIKKLRVALKLRDDDIVEILKLVDYDISKTELSAFFRREDHPNYRVLQDQILRKFLNGLIIYKRGKQKPSAQKTKKKKSKHDYKEKNKKQEGGKKRVVSFKSKS